MAGVGDPAAAAVPGVFGKAVTDIEATMERLEEAAAGIDAYARRLTGQAPAPARRVPAEARSARVERLRARLPPPVEAGTGQKTHGLWFVKGQDAAAARHVVSGKKRTAEDDPGEATHAEVQTYLKQIGLKPLAIASHIEVKLAVRMARTGLRDVVVTINNIPCPGPAGCDRLLPRILPEGATLTVFGVTEDGTRTVDYYRGAPA